MTEPMFDDLTKSLPSIEEQREIHAHNKPLIDALSLVVRTAGRAYGWGSEQHTAAARLYDDLTPRAERHERIDDPR